MDLDDRMFHYMLWFGGMALASGLHQFAGWLGWDAIESLKKLFGRKKKRHGANKHRGRRSH